MRNEKSVRPTHGGPRRRFGGPRIATAAAIVAILAVFVVVRAPLLSREALLRGWNADVAVFGLMGKRMFEGVRFDIYFWEQGYMGPLVSILAAAIAALGRLLSPGMTVGPLALRLATMLLGAAGMVFWWLVLRQAVGRAAATVAALLLAIGPAFLVRDTTCAEAAFTLIPALLFFAARGAAPGLEEQIPLRSAFVFGLLAGVSWWMNESVVFALASIAFVVAVRTSAWQRLRAGLRPVDRVLFRHDRLGWKPISPAARILFLVVEGAIVAAALWLLGWNLDLAPRPPFSGAFVFPPLTELALLMAALHALAEAGFGSFFRKLPTTFADAGRLLRPWRGSMFILAAAGFAAGDLLPILGRVFGWYQDIYGYTAGVIPLRDMPTRGVEFANRDLPEALGVAPGTAGAIFFAAIVSLLASSAWNHRRDIGRFFSAVPESWSARGLACGVIALNLIFYLTNERVILGRARYLLPALPFLYGLAAERAIELVRSQSGSPLRRRVFGVAAATIFAAAAVSLTIEASAVVRSIRAEPNPLQVVARIEAAGCRVFRADYYQAFVYQFVSEERVRGIPNRGPRRNRAESAALEAGGEPICTVDLSGKVSPPARR